jgi:hypothetical protein
MIFRPRQIDPPTDAELAKFCDDIREKQVKEIPMSDSIPAGVPMRAKFRVEAVTIFEYNQNIELQAVCGGSKEDNSYAAATPNAHCKMTITNKDLWGKFVPGQTFYVDFTPVPSAMAKHD